MSQFQLLAEKPLDTKISNEGGVVTKVDGATLLERFLILGSSGTYYASGADVTKMMTTEIKTWIETNAHQALDMVRHIAENRLALRKDPSIYVLALLSMPDIPLDVRQQAYNSLLLVCPTGTDLLHYLAFRYPEGPKGARHSGMGFRKAIGRWFTQHRNLPLQAVKYEQRDGWTLRDALRISKPKTDDEALDMSFQFIANRDKYFSMGNLRAIPSALLHAEGRSTVGTQSTSPCIYPDYKSGLLRFAYKVRSVPRAA